ALAGIATIPTTPAAIARQLKEQPHDNAIRGSLSGWGAPLDGHGLSPGGRSFIGGDRARAEGLRLAADDERPDGPALRGCHLVLREASQLGGRVDRAILSNDTGAVARG